MRLATPNMVRHLAGLLLLATLSHSAFAAEWVYTARQGDNLWNLAKEYLIPGVGFTERLRALNTIENPKRITPGTRKSVPRTAAIAAGVATLKCEPGPRDGRTRFSTRPRHSLIRVSTMPVV